MMAVAAGGDGGSGMVFGERDDETRARLVDLVVTAGEYVTRHAEDLVARPCSDEVTCADGLDITIRVRTVREPPTVEVRREAIVPAWRA
ncbi:hypothetical protein [Olsenella uli]|uniref:hypothetical protein n=1 Tax=Olsenella uli TaxID=133926 RepID=UPI00241C8CAB|nr:hypothetical protein [Olsenella uli]